MSRKTFVSIFWGVLIIALGVILGGNAINIWNINVFFPGWWTMFIILPCLYWIFKSGPDIVNVFGLIIGVVLLLGNTETFGPYISWKLFLPIVIVLIGVSIIVSAIKRANKKKNGVFSGKTTFADQRYNYDGKPFEGGVFNCSFGEMNLDLSNATINQTKPFRVHCSFGEVNVIVPKNVSVELKSNVIFGEVESECSVKQEGIPLCIEADCSFGEIRVTEK